MAIPSRILRLFFLCGLLALILPACSSDDPADPGDDGGDGGPGPDTIAPEIINIFPLDESFQIDPAQPVEIFFNDAMDPSTAEGQITLSQGSVTQLNWFGSNYLVVDHDPWPAGAPITVTVGTGLADLAGNTLTSPGTTSFYTYTDVVMLMDHHPAAGATGVNRALSVELLFSFEDMDEASLVTGVIISDDTKANIPFTIQSQGMGWYSFDPVDELAAEALITVELTSEVQNSDGSFLESPGSFTFTTGLIADAEPPTIVSLEPPSGSTLPVNQGSMTVTFSEPVNLLNFTPPAMNGQFAWVFSQSTQEPELSPDGTVLTIYLPETLPEGIPLEVTLAGYLDIFGNVQTEETHWSATVTGTADTFNPVDGYRYTMGGDEQEGAQGSTIPTYGYYSEGYFELEARSAADQWNLLEFDGNDFLETTYYDIISYTESSADLLGFAEENEGGSLTEFFTSAPLTYFEFPLSQGNTWNSSASIVLPDGTFSAIISGEVLSRGDLILGDVDGTQVTWTDAWQVHRDVEVMVGGTLVSTEAITTWVVPGIGEVRRVLREDNFDEGNWREFDHWLLLDLD